MKFNLLVVGMVILGLTGAGRVGEAGSRGTVAARPAAKPAARAAVSQPARAVAPAAVPQQDNRGIDVLDVGEGQELGPVGKYAVVKIPTKDTKTQEIRFIDDETNKVYTQQVPADLKFMVVSGAVAVDPAGKLVILEPGKGISIVDPSLMPQQETKGIVDPSLMPQN